jgi:hypothetical protein
VALELVRLILRRGAVVGRRGASLAIIPNPDQLLPVHRASRKIGFSSSNRLQRSMNKKIRLRIALIISAFALYRAFMHIHRIQTGCIQLGDHQRCSFENAANFEGLMNLDLLFTCGWVAGAVLCWIAVVQSGKEPR